MCPFQFSWVGCNSEHYPVLFLLPRLSLKSAFPYCVIVVRELSKVMFYSVIQWYKWHTVVHFIGPAVSHAVTFLETFCFLSTAFQLSFSVFERIALFLSLFHLLVVNFFRFLLQSLKVMYVYICRNGNVIGFPFDLLNLPKSPLSPNYKFGSVFYFSPYMKYTRKIIHSVGSFFFI